MDQPTKAVFDGVWAALVANNKREKYSCMDEMDYNWLVREIQLIKYKTAQGIRKTPKDYRLLRKYDVMVAGGCEWLVKPTLKETDTPNLLYVITDNLFDVIHRAHMNTNHGNLDEMLFQIQASYCNVTKQAVTTYLKLCQPCIRRDTIIAESQNYPSLPFKKYSSTISVFFGFVNMQQYPCDGYNYILVHWYQPINFYHLIPLQNTEPKNVAISLLDIYSTFGLPNFIDSPFDAPYVSSIIDHIKSVWLDDVSTTLKNPIDENAITLGNSELRKLMEPLVNNESFQINWPPKLKYLQFWKNNRIEPGSDATPYQKMLNIKGRKKNFRW